MLLAGSKLIGAGLATISLAGAGVGHGNVFVRNYAILTIDDDRYLNDDNEAYSPEDLRILATIDDEDVSKLNIEEETSIINNELVLKSFDIFVMDEQLKKTNNILLSDKLTNKEKQLKIEEEYSRLNTKHDFDQFTDNPVMEPLLVKFFLKKLAKMNDKDLNFLKDFMSDDLKKYCISISILSDYSGLFLFIIQVILNNRYFVDDSVLFETFINKIGNDYLKTNEEYLKKYYVFYFFKNIYSDFENTTGIQDSLIEKNIKKHSITNIEDWINKILEQHEVDMLWKKEKIEDKLQKKVISERIIPFLETYSSSLSLFRDVYCLINNKKLGSFDILKETNYKLLLNLFNDQWKNIYIHKYKSVIIKLFICFINAHLLIQDDEDVNSYKNKYIYFKQIIMRKKDDRYARNYLTLYNDELLNELNNIIFLYSQLPMISKPNNWRVGDAGHLLNNGGYLLNAKQFENKLIHPLTEGLTEVKLSKDAIDAINILQKKKFKINKFYLNILKSEKAQNYLGVMYQEDLNTQISEYNNEVNNFVDYLVKQKIFFNKYLKKKFLPYLKYKMYKANLKEKKQQEESILKIMKWYSKKNKITIVKERLKRKDFVNYFEELYNVKKEDNDRYEALVKQRNNLIKERSNLYRYNFMLKISELFCNYTIYFSSFFCFRLRNYPQGWGIHRASGPYKYICVNKEKKMYDETGIYWLKIAIIVCLGFNFKTKKEYITQFNKLEVSILKFFKKSPNLEALDKLNEILKDEYKINKIKDPFLGILCISEYYNYNKNNKYKSGFLLDIDQVASGPQILSLLSGCDSMNNLTNLTSGDIKNDLYTTFLEEVFKKMNLLWEEKVKVLDLMRAFVEEEEAPVFEEEEAPVFEEKEALTNEDTNVNYEEKAKKARILENKKRAYGQLRIETLDLCKLCLDRAFAKSIVMPRFYGMGKPGIIRAINKVYETKEINLDIDDEQLFQFKRFLFYAIIESITSMFGIIEGYSTWLTNLAKVVTSGNEHIRLSTLDGCLINYKYLFEKKIQKRIIGLKTQKPLRYYLYVRGHTASQLNYTTFAANFVQTIDGTFSRLIIREMYNRYKIIVQPLHDSFSVHPNDIDKLYQCIKDLYIEHLVKNKDSFVTEMFYNFVCKTLLAKNQKKLNEVLLKKPKTAQNLDELIEKIKNSDFMFFI